MHYPSHGIGLLVAAAEEYAASRVGESIAHLEDLELFVEIRQVQTMQAGAAAIFISEITASARQGQRGITITCVGMSGDMPAAVGDAVAQWTMGVLPVLASWRGKHSCFSNSRPIETGGGPFDLLEGPIAARGKAEENAPPANAVNLSEPLAGVLHNRRFSQRLHWMELYACKLHDGSVDATCRLDNRDWTAAQKILLDVASNWPPASGPIESTRQFAMLLPQKGDRQTIMVPTFFSRLFGRG